jgi:hypothetical protein
VGSTRQPGVERAKAVQLEASPCVGGGNPAGRHRRTVGRAERARWAGREAEAQWGEGERPVGEKKKMSGPQLGRKGGWAKSNEKNSFPNKI